MVFGVPWGRRYRCGGGGGGVAGAAGAGRWLWFDAGAGGINSRWLAVV